MKFFTMMRSICLVSLITICSMQNVFAEEADNQIYITNFTPKTAQEYKDLVCSHAEFKEVYEKLSAAEKKELDSYFAKAVKIWEKVAQGKLDWESFKKEATEALKPHEKLAKKLDDLDMCVFNIAVGSKHGLWRVCWHTKWLQGFAISAHKEVNVYHDSPGTADDFIAFLCKNATFATAWKMLSKSDQQEIRDYAEQMIALYHKVDNGELNHVEFQAQARAILESHDAMAQKLTNEYSICPFFMLVRFSQDGKDAKLNVGYRYSPFDKKFSVSSYMSF